MKNYPRYEKIVRGFYSSGKTPCEIFVCGNWYAIKGSVACNRTHDDIEPGIYVERIKDVDTFISAYPINSIEDLTNQLELFK